MEENYTIDLGNGVILTDLTLNGTDFMTKKEVTTNTFDGMQNVTITDNDDNTEVLNNPVLVHCDLFLDGYTYFCIRNLSDAEIKDREINEQLSKMPYIDTKKAYYNESEKTFYRVPSGNVSVNFDNYLGNYDVTKICDRVIVSFERLTQETNVTITVF